MSNFLICSVVIQELDSYFRRQFKADRWQETYPWTVYSSNLPEDMEFELWRNSKDSLLDSEPEFVEISKFFSPSQTGRRILIEAERGFGKSILCSVLAQMWAKNEPSMQHFTLCFKFQLTELDLSFDTLYDAVFEKCVNLLPITGEATKPNLQKALREINERILLIFDDFDRLNEKLKERFYRHLILESVFKKSTVVVTSRPGTGIKDMASFNYAVSVAGLSFNRIMYLLKHTSYKESLNSDARFMTEKYWRLKFLEGASPLHTFYVWKTIAAGTFQNGREMMLYELLEKVLDDILNCDRAKAGSSSTTGGIFLKTGKLFLEAMLNGHYKFEEGLLRNALGCDLDFLISGHVFQQNHRNEASRLWVPSNKAVMIFFAVNYLRHIFLSEKYADDTLDKIKRTLCFGRSSGDYVCSEDDEWHFVGILPEVVFSARNDGDQLVHWVKMIHDVAPAEKSSAFDSVNLLLRIDRPRLHRFGFQEVSEEDQPDRICEMESVFENILNGLCFDGCTVANEYYYNDYEDKHFLKVLVDDPDNQVVVLKTAVRATTDARIERIHVDFKFSHLNQLFEFLRSLIVTAVPQFHLELSADSSVGNFVCELCSALLQIDAKRKVVFKCGVDSSSETPTGTLHFFVVTPPECNEQCSRMGYTSYDMVQLCEIESANHTSESFPTKRENISSNIDNCESAAGAFISMDIM